MHIRVYPWLNRSDGLEPVMHFVRVLFPRGPKARHSSAQGNALGT